MSYPPSKSPRASGDVTDKLKDGRREKLLNIKKREELKDMLLYKFKDKYGDGNSTAIGKEVGRFCDKAAVTQNNLARLERRIQHVKSPRKGPVDPDARSDVSAYSHRSVATPRSCLSARGSALAGSALASNLASNLKSPRNQALTPVQEGGSELEFQGFDWAKLDEYASFLHEQDSARQKVGTNEMQRKLRGDLDKQVADARRKKHRVKDEDQKYFTNQVVEVEAWKVQEKAKVDLIQSKNYKERADRDEQMRQQKERREADAAQADAEEKALVFKIKAEMDAEKDRLNERKEQQRLAMLQIMEENLEDRKIKDAQREEQVQMEIEGMREYNRILDAQDAKRAAELDNRLTRQKDLMERMKESVVAVQGKKDEEDARRAERQKLEADAKALHLETEKKSKLAALRLDTQDFLFQQMLEKEDRKEQAYELKRLQATILEQDTQAFEESEKARAAERRRLNVEHRLELDAQMERKRAEAKYIMSDAEVKMNKHLLRVVNKTLQDRDDEVAASPCA